MLILLWTLAADGLKFEKPLKIGVRLGFKKKCTFYDVITIFVEV